MIKIKIKKSMAPKLKLRLKRKMRARSSGNLNGTEKRPRLCVFKSNKYIYAQLIDDDNNRVLACVNSLQKGVKDSSKSNKDVDSAKKVGSSIADKAKAIGVETVVFDRNGYPYLGKVKALAEAVREKGIKL